LDSVAPLTQMAKLIERIELALQEGELDEKVNWRRSLATLLAGLGIAVASPMARGADSDEALNKSWQELTPKMRQELRQDERDWIKWKEKLPAEQQEWANLSRATYLMRFSPDPAMVEVAKESEKGMREAGNWIDQNTQTVQTATPMATPTAALEPFRLPIPAKGLESGRWDIYGKEGILGGVRIPSSLRDETLSPDLKLAVWNVRRSFNISKMSDREIMADPKLHVEVQKELDNIDQDRKGKEASEQQRQQSYRDWVTNTRANDPGYVEEDFNLGYRWGRFYFHGRTSTSGGSPGPVQQRELSAFYNTALMAAHNRGQEIKSLSSFQKGFEQAVDDMWGIAPF
jgi:hypothetical protein